MWRFLTSLMRRTFSGLNAVIATLALISTSGCGAKEPGCIYPDQLFEQEPEQLTIIGAPNGQGIIAKYVWGVSWYALHPDGTVGAVLHRWPAGLRHNWSRRVLWAEPNGDGIRLLLENGVVELEPGSEVGQFTRFGFDGDFDEDSVSVTQFVAVGDTLYAVWQAPTVRNQTSWVAGLARLDGTTLRRISAPFYQADGTTWSQGPRLRGGFEPDEQRFWFEGAGSYRVELDGSATTSTEVRGAGWLSEWAKLPSGRWAGTFQDILNIYAPLETPPRRSLRTGIPLTQGNSGSTTLFLDGSGALWLLSGAGMRRWDEATATLGELQPLSIRAATCDSYVPLFE